LKPTNSTSAFYAVADSRHFLGLVGMINSLRLVGHDEPIFVADLGLSDSERRVLADQVTLVAVPDAKAPHLAKTAVPLLQPSDVMVLVDADLVVTRPLTELIESARTGRVVAFADQLRDRFDERWAELLDLGQVRPRPYLNSGVVVMDRIIGISLLEQVAAGCTRVDPRKSCANPNGRPDYPFYYLDQDVFNAVLSAFEPERVQALEHALAPIPPFDGLRLVDETRLRCAYRDGLEPYVLHHIRDKPWLSATRWNLYSRLLARLLLQPDVAIQLERDRVPLRLRDGRLGWIEKRRCGTIAWLKRVRGKLGVRRALARHLARNSRMDGTPPAGDPVR
jgi:hypothetical protein